MRIQKSNVVMDENYKNILVKEFAINYKDMSNLGCPEDIVRVMNDVFDIKNQSEEYVYMIAMTSKGKPISFFEVSHGTCCASLVGMREIMIRALLSGAVNIIIVHNHPSGCPAPSKEDLNITKRIKDATDLMGIYFCDHIIIGRDGFFSFREREILNGKE